MTASTLDEALQLYRKTPCGIVLLDRHSSSATRETLKEVLGLFFEGHCTDIKGGVK